MGLPWRDCVDFVDGTARLGLVSLSVRCGLARPDWLWRLLECWLLANRGYTLAEYYLDVCTLVRILDCTRCVWCVVGEMRLGFVLVMALLVKS